MGVHEPSVRYLLGIGDEPRNRKKTLHNLVVKGPGISYSARKCTVLGALSKLFLLSIRIENVQ